MEQTLGKRIAENRKRLGLTQDGLAEKLGITAQAVSKWENDQSCPDITTLPRLAEIFGITTDELLGYQNAEKVHEGEVVTDADTDDTDEDTPYINIDRNENGKWEFHWDSGKRGAVWFAVTVLWIGALTLLSKILHWEAGFWDILWPSALLFWGLKRFIRDFSIFKLCLVACGGAYLLNNLGIWSLDISGELIFPIIVVLFGVSLLIDALKKPNKPRFTVTRNGKRMASGSEKSKCHCVNEEDRFFCQLSFGENTHRVNLASLAGGEATVSFGELTVDLQGCQQLKNDCLIDATCSFGELVLLVPKKFRVENESSTAFASVDFVGEPDPMPEGVIHLDASISFGEMTIKYI